MCDTLCALGRERTLFAKNSDRPPGEAQLIEAHPRRPAGGELRTQYLTIEDTGAHALLGSRPEWLWGLEHGVNEHRVAIGNEKIWTVDDPRDAPPALIGMDLVRLGLERAATADEAVDVMTTLLERHGQGGPAEAPDGDAYWSSFLVADPTAAWVLETSGRTWAARPVEDAAAISNRVTIGTDWSKASADVDERDDFDRWRLPRAATGHADRRLAVTRACLATGADAVTPAHVAATLRDHGGRDTPPGDWSPDGDGVSVCMHLRGTTVTTSSIVAELPREPDAPLRAWVAPGSPCVSVYLPVFPPSAVPPELAETCTWKRFAALRDRVESEPDVFDTIRRLLAPIEAELWSEADDVADDPARWPALVADAWRRVSDGVDRAVEAC